jgi:hypothetical protein
MPKGSPELARRTRRYQSDLPVSQYNRLSHVVSNAIARCTDPQHKLWHYYGGRGIRVYQPWLQDPSAFLRYLTTLPCWCNPTLVIDRIDNDGHYEPGNLRFVTRSVSQRNKRSWGALAEVVPGVVLGQLTVVLVNGDQISCRCSCSMPVQISRRGLVYGAQVCQSCVNRLSWISRKARSGVPSDVRSGCNGK